MGYNVSLKCRHKQEHKFGSDRDLGQAGFDTSRVVNINLGRGRLLDTVKLFRGVEN